MGITSDEGSSIESKGLPLNPSAQDLNRRNAPFVGYDCRAKFGKGARRAVPIQIVYKMANQASPLIAPDDSRTLPVERNALDYASPALETVSPVGSDVFQGGQECPPVAVFEPPATSGGMSGKSVWGSQRTEDGKHRTGGRTLCAEAYPEAESEGG